MLFLIFPGVFIHSLVGNLKPGDIPAEVRVKCIDAHVKKYFVPDSECFYNEFAYNIQTFFKEDIRWICVTAVLVRLFFMLFSVKTMVVRT